MFLSALSLNLFLTGVIASAEARSVTFADVCSNYTISRRGDDLLIRCPGEKEPWMTIKECKNPRAKRSGSKVTIFCEFKK